jgi:hypothetical protein
VFRFEYYYLLKDGSFSDIPWITSKRSSPSGMQDVAAIVVDIAVVEIRGSKIAVDTDVFRAVAMMNSATAGEVLFDDDKKIVERNTGLIADGHVWPKKPKEGWNNYTSFQFVRIDEGNRGDLGTFSSNSWGGRHAATALINSYRAMGKRDFPVIALETKPRNDKNGNIETVFRVVGWTSPSRFTDLVPSSSAPAAPVAVIEYAPDRTGHDPDDDLPF